MLARLINIALLGLFPLAWQAPLASAEIAWLFTVEEISIFGAIEKLYDTDLFLCAIVALFAVAAPYAKTVSLIYVQFSDTHAARRIMPVVELLGRLSMIDVFVLAFYVVVYRGISDIEIEWGAYFFTVLVLLSIYASYATRAERFRIVPTEPKARAARPGAAPDEGA